jgi:hypothetical protein
MLTLFPKKIINEISYLKTGKCQTKIETGEMLI